jgi:hypothetical protein
VIEIDTYRVSSDKWRRTWQAEWNGCQRAPRAWTELGVRRKAIRWIARKSREA